MFRFGKILIAVTGALTIGFVAHAIPVAILAAPVWGGLMLTWIDR